MDFIVTRGDRTWRFRPLSARGRAWLARNFSSSRDLVVPAANGSMVRRALRMDRLGLVPGDTEDGPRDFHDQQSMLFGCRAERLAGRSQGALHRLMPLRACVLVSADPRGYTLLRLIDREIVAAHAACRADAGRDSAATGRRWSPATWIRRAPRQTERAMMRVAISIMLAVNVSRVLPSKF